VPYQVRVEQASPRVLAAVRAVTAPERLSADIIRLLDQVWPLLREQGASTGHNVVIYYPGEGGAFTIDAGVEVFSDFEERGDVRRVATPAGEAAVTAHYGEYSAMRRQRPSPGGGELGGLRRLGRRPSQPPDRRLRLAQPNVTCAPKKK
jgi:effector-binding domain-containing protein